MNRQQVIRSANVGSIHLNRTNVKFTWYKHRITNELSTCSEGDKMQSYFLYNFLLSALKNYSKVGKFYKLNEALWIYIIASKPLHPARCLV